MASITSQLPVKFTNGEGCHEFKGKCVTCRRELPTQLLRGAVTRPIPSVIVIEAAGVCHECRVVSSFFCRLHDDLRITAMTNGKWHTWRIKPTLLERFAALLGFNAK